MAKSLLLSEQRKRSKIGSAAVRPLTSLGGLSSLYVLGLPDLLALFLRLTHS